MMVMLDGDTAIVGAGFKVMVTVAVSAGQMADDTATV